VAFVNCYERGLINKSYYISLYTDYAALESVVDQDISKTAPVMRSFAEFAHRVHTKGIYHEDFNVTNVLYSQNGADYLFSLIDNNRMSFGKYKMNKAIHNLRRLTLGSDYFGVIAKAYAKASGEDELMVLKRLSSSRFGFMKRIRKKQFIKRVLRR
jgi:tRNA A-37 threonylcarbamoyl transferase component Bud32